MHIKPAFSCLDGSAEVLNYSNDKSKVLGFSTLQQPCKGVLQKVAQANALAVHVFLLNQTNMYSLKACVKDVTCDRHMVAGGAAH